MTPLDLHSRADSVDPVPTVVAENPHRESLKDIARRVGERAAGPAAADVDAKARIPSEALAEMKAEGLLGAFVPAELGGLGASIREVSEAVRELAHFCASSALILAMHSAEVYMMAQFGTSPGLRSLLADIARDQLLLCSGASEVGVGGDYARSICALTPDGEGYTIDKKSLAVSYGQASDIVMLLARRSPDAADNDQIYFACPVGDLTSEPLSTWDTMGLRGTCSFGVHFTGPVRPEYIFPIPWGEVGSRGGNQVPAIMVSSVWVGLAEAAAGEAHAHVRAAARKTIGTIPPSALRLAEVVDEVQRARGILGDAIRQVDERTRLGDAGAIDLVTMVRDVKVSTSSIAVKVATEALAICGILGYKRDAGRSIERIVRDAHGGLVMISNDRYLHLNAETLVARKSF